MFLELAENSETVTNTQQYVPVETNQGVLNVRADIVPQITGTTTPTSVDPGGIWYTTGEVDLLDMPSIGANKINSFAKLTQLEFEPGTFGTEPNVFKRTVAAPGTNLYGYVLKSKLTQKEPIIVPTGTTATMPIPNEPTGTQTPNIKPIQTKPKYNKLLLAGLGVLALYFIFRKK